MKAAMVGCSRVVAVVIAVVTMNGAQSALFAQEGSPRLNRTIELLSAGEPVFGIFGWDHSVDNAMAIARSDLDYVLIDLEHRPYDIDTLRYYLLAMTDKGRIAETGSLQMPVTPIVRLPTSNRAQTEAIAKQVLGMGAFGLMFPSVSTKEDALHAVRVSRYPQKSASKDLEPAGLRGYEPFHPGMWYWGVPRDEYLRRADVWPLDPDGEILVVLQIETEQAVDSIEDIVSVPGVGAVLVGAFDLSASLGVPNEIRGPEVQLAVEKVRDACLARNIPVGTTGGDLSRLLEEGFRFNIVGVDIGLPARTQRNLQRALEAAGRN